MKLRAAWSLTVGHDWSPGHFLDMHDVDSMLWKKTVHPFT